MAKKFETAQVRLQPPAFPRILKKNGGPIETSTGREDMLAFAAWYFTLNAHRILHEVPAQATMEGDTDVTVNLRTVAESTALAYGFDDLNEVMAFMPGCRHFAFQLGLTWDSRFQAWIDSGGRAYDEVTREPDRI